MKFVFDRAVKGRKDGHAFFSIEVFDGLGPWDRQGITFQTAEDWFEHAKKIGRALGITECECAILPAESTKQCFIFSFKHQRDQIAFNVAAFGNQEAEFPRDILFSSPEEKGNAIPKIVNFLKQNEIDGDVRDASPTSVRVITKSRFDDYTIIHAALKGTFAMRSQDHQSDPSELSGRQPL